MCQGTLRLNGLGESHPCSGHKNYENQIVDSTRSVGGGVLENSETDVRG